MESLSNNLTCAPLLGENVVDRRRPNVGNQYRSSTSQKVANIKSFLGNFQSEETEKRQHRRRRFAALPKDVPAAEESSVSTSGSALSDNSSRPCHATPFESPERAFYLDVTDDLDNVDQAYMLSVYMQENTSVYGSQSSTSSLSDMSSSTSRSRRRRGGAYRNRLTAQDGWGTSTTWMDTMKQTSTQWNPSAGGSLTWTANKGWQLCSGSRAAYPSTAAPSQSQLPTSWDPNPDMAVWNEEDTQSVSFFQP